jgi:hypothetical protein
MQRIESALQYDDYFPNATLAADWDLVNEIAINMRSMEHPPTLQHIKSHQDKHKRLCDLPLFAQLNCAADRLADAFLQQPELASDCTRVPLMPHAGAQLHLPQGTITGKIKRPVIEASRGPALLEHIRVTNNWDPTTLDLVDWDSHGVVLRNTPHEVTMIKMIHGLLPVGARTSKYHPKYSDKCPTCKTAIETTLHFYHCSTPCRRKWKSKLITTLRVKAEKLNTRPPLIDVMLEGVLLFLQGADHLDPSTVPPPYRELVRQQNRIGWLNFLNGRWSLEWKKLQSNFCQPESGNSQWASQMIRTLWESIFEVWEQRNKDLHGVDAATRNAAERVVFSREIRELYLNRETFPEEFQHIFETHLDTLLGKKNYQLKNWLAIWRPVLEMDTDSL